MSRTYKDRKKNKENMFGQHLRQPVREFSRQYLNFKRNGPCEEGDCCPDCGGFTELQDGYLVCSECGWAECEMMPLIDELVA